MKKFLAVFIAALLLVCTVPFSASAAGTVTRTESLDLRKPEFRADRSNADEGWSWDFETLTLTLDNVHFDSNDLPAIYLYEDSMDYGQSADTTTIVLIGENLLESACAVQGGGVIDGQPANLRIKGDGKLTVDSECRYGLMTVSSLYIDSGEVSLLHGQTWILGTFEMNGGKLTVNATETNESHSQGADGLYILDHCVINGGTLDLTAERSPITVVGNSVNNTGTTKGLIIKGGDITLRGGKSWIGAWVGATYDRDIVIETTGTITVENSAMGLYCAKGTIYYNKGVINNPQELSFANLLRNPNGEVVLGKADYSALDAFLSKVPENLDDYTPESVEALQAAIDAVDYELNLLDQAKVDEYVQAIEAALEGLEENSFFSKIEKFFENLFNGEGGCPVLDWLKRVIDIILAFFSGIFNGIFG